MTDHIAGRALRPGGADDAVDEPSRNASTSLVDLSVSTTNSAWPAFTDWPSATSHSTIFTSPPVAPRWGMTIGCFTASAFPALPKRCMRRSTSRCMASRPGTRTSSLRPDPMTS